MWWNHCKHIYFTTEEGKNQRKRVAHEYKTFFWGKPFDGKRFGILKGQLHGSAPGHQSTTLQSESVRGNAPNWQWWIHCSNTSCWTCTSFACWPSWGYIANSRSCSGVSIWSPDFEWVKDSISIQLVQKETIFIDQGSQRVCATTRWKGLCS